MVHTARHRRIVLLLEHQRLLGARLAPALYLREQRRANRLQARARLRPLVRAVHANGRTLEWHHLEGRPVLELLALAHPLHLRHVPFAVHAEEASAHVGEGRMRTVARGDALLESVLHHLGHGHAQRLVHDLLIVPLNVA